MNPMVQKLATLGPEITLLIGACLCILVGLWPSATIRRRAPLVAGIALIFAGYLLLPSVVVATPEINKRWTHARDQALARQRAEAAAATQPADTEPATQPLAAQHQELSLDDAVDFLIAHRPFRAYSQVQPWSIGVFVRFAVIVIGFLLLCVTAALPDHLKQVREVDRAGPAHRFDPALTFRGEFFAFFLLSLTGVMLTAAATDLVWLFLALELVSLPTYVMVAVSRDRIGAQEAAVKYFFLGALAVAVFLYGFALIYGATGFTDLAQIHVFVAAHKASPLLITGITLAIVGISFKIAAVPMHFYAADVYQGAATPVTAFLAFVPKAAGFVALFLILSTLGWPLPAPIYWTLWIMAAATMTVGNVLGLLQSNVKRIMAYSSIAHSGYMLVGLIVGAELITAPGVGAPALGNGIGALLFYLVTYGLATLAVFAILASLQSRGEEIQSLDDLSGIVQRCPGHATILAIGLLSLIGLPPLAGFLGKLYLFGSAVSFFDTDPAILTLVIIALLNSAISAVYYLRIAAAAFFGKPAAHVTSLHAPGRVGAASFAALGVILVGFAGSWLVDISNATMFKPRSTASTPHPAQSGESDAPPASTANQPNP